MDLLQDDLQALYTVHEWSDSNIGPFQHGTIPNSTYINYYNSSINNEAHWRRISALSCLKQSNTEDIVSDRENSSFFDDILNSGRNDLLFRIESDYIYPNRLNYSDIESLLLGGWLAFDCGHRWWSRQIHGY